MNYGAIGKGPSGGSAAGSGAGGVSMASRSTRIVLPFMATLYPPTSPAPGATDGVGFASKTDPFGHTA